MVAANQLSKLIMNMQIFYLDRGAKQGDSLSPTLFNYFINDLHEIFNLLVTPLYQKNQKSYVDDLVILSSTHKGLQNVLNKLEKYCFDWQLTVNIKKTKVMTFQNTYSPTSSLFYNNQLSLEVKEYNFLGNIINLKGSFKTSIQGLTQKRTKSLICP